MKRTDDTKLTITDWPAFERTTVMHLDPRLHASEQALADWAEQRFGPGNLRKTTRIGDAAAYIYQRRLLVPQPLRKLAAFLLNKSYT